jgi:excisionase family DNA binding protein
VKSKPSKQPSAALFLTKVQLAEALNVCERTVDREINKGTIKAVHIGRTVRIPNTELARLLACVEA